MMKRIFQNHGKIVSSSPVATSSDRIDDPSLTTSSVQDADIPRQPLHLQIDASNTKYFHTSSNIVSLSSRTASLDMSDSSRNHSTFDWIHPFEDTSTVHDSKLTDPSESVSTHLPKCEIEMNCKSHIISSTTNVSSALDYVLAELEQQKQNMVKGLARTISEGQTRHCSSLTYDDSISNFDNSSTVQLETQSTSNIFLVEDLSAVDPDREPAALTSSIVHSSTPSLRIESSMLLPEESLNFIAQMKILGDDRIGSSDEQNPILCTSPQLEKDTERDSSYSFHTSMSSHVHYDGSIPTFTASHGASTNSTDMVADPRHVALITRPMPIIAGTAAATTQHHLKFSKKSQFISLGPFLSGPRDEDVETTMLTDTVVHEDNTDTQSLYNGLSSKILNKSFIPKTSQGMDILADITSYAAPISVDDGEYTDVRYDVESAKNISKLNTGHHDMKSHDLTPVGQSLSIYAAIAAQAGIMTCFSSQSRASYETSHTSSVNNDDILPSSVHSSLDQSVQMENTLPDATFSGYTRTVGKVRRFSVDKGYYGDWVDLPYHSLAETTPRRWHDLNLDDSIEIPLNRGGRLRVFPNFLTESRCNGLTHAMNTSSSFHQDYYESDRPHSECRSHCFLSSNLHIDSDEDGEWTGGKEGPTKLKSAQCSFSQGNVTAKSMSRMPDIEEIATDLADLYSLPNREWNLGVDAIICSNKNDLLEWCPDYSQGDFLILYTIITGNPDSQQILFKPKDDVGSLAEDDEEILLYLGQGDALAMDGPMQAFYKHCFHTDNDQSHSISLLAFRHGEMYFASGDNSIRTSMNIRNDSNEREHLLSTNSHLNLFGHPRNGVLEGKGIFSREFLRETRAHSDEERSVCGNIRDGCYSLLIDKLNQSLREEDGLCWIQLTCARGDGGGALCKSYQRKLPIRVFRSSTLGSMYAPCTQDNSSVVFRYDGLYCVRAMWDSAGNETEDYPPVDGDLHTFFLIRLQKKPLDVPSENGLYFNFLSLQELWTQIQKLRGVRTPLKFDIPQPRMKLPPLSRGNADDCRRPNHILKKKVLVSNKRSTSSESSLTKGLVRLPASGQIIPSKRKIKASYAPTEKHPTSHESATDKITFEKVGEAPVSHRCDNTESSVLVSFKDSDGDPGYAHEKSYPPSELLATSSDQKPFNVRTQHVNSAKETQLNSLTCDINEGSRVFVEYKDILYQASVRKCRLKGDEWNYLIHYEGNKRTNVHWIPRSMIHSVESDRHNKAENNDLLVEKAQHSFVSASEKIEHSNEHPKKRGRKKLLVKHLDNFGACDEISVPTVTLADQQPKKRGRKKFEPKELDQSGACDKSDSPTDTVADQQTKKRGRKKLESKHLDQSGACDKSNSPTDTAAGQQPKKRGRKKLVLKHPDQGGACDETDSVDIMGCSWHKDKDLRPNRTASEQPETRSGVAVSNSKKIMDQDTPTLKSDISDTSILTAKYAVGTNIYVEYKGILYLASVLNTRTDGDESEYLVHYDGFKKTANEWVSANVVFPMISSNVRRFNAQRKEALKRSLKTDHDGSNTEPHFESSHPNKRLKKDNDESTKKLKDAGVSPGVEFLPGSCVFVELENKVYLGKMAKRRKNGDNIEYLLVFDDDSLRPSQRWTPLSMIFEINPRTRRVYEITRNKSGPTINDPQPYENPKTSNVSLIDNKTAKIKVSSAPQWAQSVSSGVDFLPGSTLFVRSNDGLLRLAKMLKKRGKGDDQEYFVSYDDNKMEQDWVSVDLVYEINPQTKRIYNKQAK